MSLFGLGKKKEEVKVEPACACNGEVATYEASSCCCGGQQVENCCGGDNKVTSIKVLGAGCKSCHDQYENVKKAIEELGLGIEVEYITDMEKVMAKTAQIAIVFTHAAWSSPNNLTSGVVNVTAMILPIGESAIRTILNISLSLEDLVIIADKLPYGRFNAV